MTSTERVAIVGTGLMGTSIAMAALRAGCGVRGYDANPDVLARASQRVGFEVVDNLPSCVRDASLVFVCTPIGTIAGVAIEVLAAAPDAVVSDVGSVKAHVVSEVERRTRGDPVRFVGGHPMGGSERSGPEGASAALLDGIVLVVTTTARTDPLAARRLESWILAMGAQPVRIDPERHDRTVAVVSHLPQVASTALMAVAALHEADEPEVLRLAAGGFRDLTRLAASNPALWGDILLANRDALARAIDAYVARLEYLRDLVVRGRLADVEAAFAEAKRARLELGAKPQVKAGVALIQVPVPDRPGVLADLTAGLSERGVNIEDFQIVHSAEGGRGTVHLTVAISDAAVVADALAARGYEPLRLA